jgi:hypothetical protein
MYNVKRNSDTMNQVLPQILRETVASYREQKQLCLCVAEEMFKQRIDSNSPRRNFKKELNNNISNNRNNNNNYYSSTSNSNN